MSRYRNTKITKTKKTQLREKTSNRYKTTIYQKVPESNTDLFIITQEGDRLDLLAHQIYGNSNLWWYIAQTNHLNSMNIEPGTSLRISTSIEAAEGY